MRKIDINEIENIKEELNNLQEDETLCITENGHEKFMLMSVDAYDALTSEDNADVFSEENLLRNPNIRVISPDNFELTYDEYENVKKQVMDAFEKTFKPKPEKLN